MRCVSARGPVERLATGVSDGHDPQTIGKYLIADAEWKAIDHDAANDWVHVR